MSAIEPGQEDEIVAEANKAIRDGDTVKISRYFADALDSIHTRPSSSAWSEDSPTAAEQDRTSREDFAFRRALQMRVSENLESHGIVVTRVVETGQRDGYHVTARDQQRRRYEVSFAFSVIEEIIATGGHVDCVRRLFDRVTQAILEERDRYFRRMR